MNPEKWWDSRAPAVRARIERLNPNIFRSPEMYEGRKLRGWNPAKTAWMHRMWFDCVGKRSFIREYGRKAWEWLPESSLRRDGRRVYVDRAAVLDQLWLLH